MIISGKTILEKWQKHDLKISPFDPTLQLQPASVDLRLGNDFKIVNDQKVDKLYMDKQADYKSVEVVQNKITIPPQTFMLATTCETIQLPSNLTAFVEGRSSVGRLGLFIQNAGWVDPGFCGQITLELYNSNQVPIEVEVGRRICQLVIAKLDKEADEYKGKYVKQVGATVSQIYLDQDKG